MDAQTKLEGMARIAALALYPAYAWNAHDFPEAIREQYRAIAKMQTDWLRENAEAA
jgi:hypothetical protein